ncbi:MAG: hypothetical protein K9H49_18780 [Bacteroidales bacterium]|nr:hypothetical protein [Bacteroidales bacterium]
MRLFKRQKKNQFIPDEKLSQLNTIQFSFRDGFSERISARLENMLDEDPSINYIMGLSSLLPRFLVISSIILLIFAISLFFMHGELNLEAFIGTSGVDENNFISYLNTP